jgi:hypothetical protein
MRRRGHQDTHTRPRTHRRLYLSALTPAFARGPVARPIRQRSRPRARYARLTTHSQRDTPHRSQRYKHFCRAPGPGTRCHFRQHAVACTAPEPQAMHAIACTAPEPYPCPRVHSSRISGLSLHQRVQDSSARISGLSLHQRVRDSSARISGLSLRQRVRVRRRGPTGT